MKMVEENTIQDCYENCKWKTVVGFPEHYCDLSYEQKRFVEELLQNFESDYKEPAFKISEEQLEELETELEDLEYSMDRISSAIRNLHDSIS